MKKPVHERLLSKVNVIHTGCWEWTGYVCAEGYGKLFALGETLAHRVSFIVHKGPLLGDICVLHRCDNPRCVNPEHLFLGDRDANNKDRADKERTVIHNSLKTHCKRGHIFNVENTYVRKGGQRFCRKCAVIYQKNRKTK